MNKKMIDVAQIINQTMVKTARVYCAENGIRHKDLARMMGIAPAQISHLLTGRNIWSPKQIQRFINATGVHFCLQF